MDPVTATKVLSEEGMFGDDVPAGAFFIPDDEKHFYMLCPCGCSQLSVLPIDGSRGWRWDGNRDKPTINPSIRQMSGCKYHGFIQAGVWTFCSDSGR